MRVLRLLSVSLAIAFSFAATLSPGVSGGGEFPLKDGDIWVMAGDSITAQHLHSNYFEAFCFARYPKLKFAFRNSGVGGHTIPTTLARFDYDIAAWKPTVVSVELGMNDKGRFTPEEYIANMTTMVKQIRGIDARPVMLTASPVNSGDTMASLGQNQRLHDYAVSLKGFSASEKVPFADQFHLLIDVWGKNKPAESLANAMPMLRKLSLDPAVAGAEGLKTFVAAQDALPKKPVSMQGDPVHPGAPGQVMMAAALLKELGAEAFVSRAVVDASGKIAEAKGCTIENAKGDGKTLTFDRLDESVPFPIPADTNVVMALDPTIAALSDYTLVVTGLKAGRHQLAIGGVAVGDPRTDKEWAAGVNVAALAYGPTARPAGAAANPIVAQGQAILAAVGAKEGLVGQWRALSQRAHAKDAPENLKTELAALTKRVEAEDEKIRGAAKPRTLRFELTFVPDVQ